LSDHYGINAIIYGPKGAGKSRLGDTTPAPRVVLDAEAGSRFTPSRKKRWDPVSERPPEADGTWDTALVTVRDFRAVQKAYEWLNSGQHPFRSVVIDSISEVQQRGVDDIAGTKQMQTQDWGQLLRIVSDLVRKFRDLISHPTNPLDAVVFIAMARQREGQWEPHVQGQLATTMPYYVDVVSYLAPVLNPETGEIIRRLFCGPFQGYMTGERVGGCLGPYIDNPTVTGMLGMIRDYLDPPGDGQAG
jgi:AAA domain